MLWYVQKWEYGGRTRRRSDGHEMEMCVIAIEGATSRSDLGGYGRSNPSLSQLIFLQDACNYVTINDWHLHISPVKCQHLICLHHEIVHTIALMPSTNPPITGSPFFAEPMLNSNVLYEALQRSRWNSSVWSHGILQSPKRTFSIVFACYSEHMGRYITWSSANIKFERNSPIFLTFVSKLTWLLFVRKQHRSLLRLDFSSFETSTTHQFLLLFCGPTAIQHAYI